MKHAISHLGHLLFLLLGLYLAFRGMEDFGLLLFGKITDAEVVEVSTRSVRVGKRGRGVQHYAKYEFTAADDVRYTGSGEMPGRMPPEKGVIMEIRYLSFHPDVNAPKDDVLGTGVLLTIIGCFLVLITLGAWRRKVGAADAPPPSPRVSKNRKS